MIIHIHLISYDRGVKTVYNLRPTAYRIVHSKDGPNFSAVDTVEHVRVCHASGVRTGWVIRLLTLSPPAQWDGCVDVLTGLSADAVGDADLLEFISAGESVSLFSNLKTFDPQA